MPRLKSVRDELTLARKNLSPRHRRDRRKPYPDFRTVINEFRTMNDAKQQGLPIVTGSAIPNDELRVHMNPAKRMTQKQTYQERLDQIFLMANRQFKRLGALRRKGSITAKQYNEYAKHFWKYFLAARDGAAVEGAFRNSQTRANSYSDLLRFAITHHPTYKQYYSELVKDGEQKKRVGKQRLNEIVGHAPVSPGQARKAIQKKQFEEITAKEFTALFAEAREDQKTFELLVAKSTKLQNIVKSKFAETLSPTEADAACLLGLWSAIRNLKKPFQTADIATGYIYRSMEGKLKEANRKNRMKEAHYEDIPSVNRKVTGEFTEWN